MAETNYKVIDFYDGEGDATEAFADVIARRITGRVNEANFETLLNNAQREQTTLKEQIEAAQNKGAEEEQKVQDAKAWTEWTVTDAGKLYPSFRSI